MAKVEFLSVTKTYAGSVRALDDLSLSIEDGEFVVVLGPSGCGKTTLLRVLAGLESPSSGAITMDGEPVGHRAPRDRDVAMVFQNSALYPHLTAHANIAFGLRRRGVGRSEADRRVREIAEQLGVRSLLRRKPKALSGGERQRVALARAIVRRPRAFLLDEPLSNLDAGLRVELRRQLKVLHRAFGVTTVYVTHDQEEAMTLGERIAVMCEGKIRQTGPPLDVYNVPADRFVAGFVGTPTMNFIEGRLVRAGDEMAFEIGPKRIPLEGRIAEAAIGSIRDECVLGVRPERLRLTPDDSAAPLTGKVVAVEPRGDRKDVHLASPGVGRLIARVDASFPAAEQVAFGITIDATSTHLFEPGPNGCNVLVVEDADADGRRSGAVGSPRGEG